MENEQSTEKKVRRLKPVIIPLDFSEESKAYLAIEALRYDETLQKKYVLGAPYSDEDIAYNKNIDIMIAKRTAAIIKKYGVEEEYLAKYNKQKAELQAQIDTLTEEMAEIDLDIQLIS